MSSLQTSKHLVILNMVNGLKLAVIAKGKIVGWLLWPASATDWMKVEVVYRHNL